MKRLLSLILIASAVALPAGAATVRQPVVQAEVSVARVPRHPPIAVPLSANGKFNVEVENGTYTMTVTMPKGYLEKWIQEELGSRGWMRCGKGGGSHPYRLTATDPEGKVYTLDFDLFVTVLDTADNGDYVKNLRWHHVEAGHPFKFSIRKGILAGVIERQLVVE